MILNAHEARAAYDCMMALNNVDGKLDAKFSGKRVREDSEGRVEVYECMPAGSSRVGQTEFYIDQLDFYETYLMG